MLKSKENLSDLLEKVCTFLDGLNKAIEINNSETTLTKRIKFLQHRSVGPGAVIYPTHLHLEIRECNTNNSAEILDSSKEFNLAPEIKKGTFKWNNKNFGNIYPGPKRFAPFNHDKVYNNLM